MQTKCLLSTIRLDSRLMLKSDRGKTIVNVPNLLPEVKNWPVADSPVTKL